MFVYFVCVCEVPPKQQKKSGNAHVYGVIVTTAGDDRRASARLYKYIFFFSLERSICTGVALVAAHFYLARPIRHAEQHSNVYLYQNGNGYGVCVPRFKNMRYERVAQNPKLACARLRR